MKLEIEVRRKRFSATQGEAYVYINGKEITGFGDKIELIKPGETYYGELVGSWASRKPDSDFVKGLLYHPFDEYYHFKDKVIEILEELGKQEERRKEA